MPVVREIAKELDIKGPFERDALINLAVTAHADLHPVDVSYS